MQCNNFACLETFHVPIVRYKEGRYTYIADNWNQTVQKSDGPNTYSYVVRSSE